VKKEQEQLTRKIHKYIQRHIGTRRSTDGFDKRLLQAQPAETFTLFTKASEKCGEKTILFI